MKKFISCDWGTSALRLRLVDVGKQITMEEVAGNHGISDTYKAWKQQELDEEQRLSFYMTILKKHVEELAGKVNSSLQDMPMIISGMASSSIGMAELPYKELPFRIDGDDLKTAWIQATDEFRHDIVLVSGVKTLNDVMRGEETQLIGCRIDNDAEQTFIFPGTHSKHIFVKRGSVTEFKTYMTGEFFSLLSTQSVLANGIERSEKPLKGKILKSFEEGLASSERSNLLHTSFMTRTNQLFGYHSKEENYYYLSGLLIGTELKELIDSKAPIALVSNKRLMEYYVVALRKLGMREVETINGDEAIVKGHCKMYKKISN